MLLIKSIQVEEVEGTEVTLYSHNGVRVRNGHLDKIEPVETEKVVSQPYMLQEGVLTDIGMTEEVANFLGYPLERVSQLTKQLADLHTEAYTLKNRHDRDMTTITKMWEHSTNELLRMEFQMEAIRTLSWWRRLVFLFTGNLRY